VLAATTFSRNVSIFACTESLLWGSRAGDFLLVEDVVDTAFFFENDGGGGGKGAFFFPGNLGVGVPDPAPRLGLKGSGGGGGSFFFFRLPMVAISKARSASVSSGVETCPPCIEEFVSEVSKSAPDSKSKLLYLLLSDMAAAAEEAAHSSK